MYKCKRNKELKNRQKMNILERLENIKKRKIFLDSKEKP